MKKIIIIAIAVLASMGIDANAQNRKNVENVIEIGSGLSFNDDDTARAGLALSGAYGLDLFLTPDLSIMPMIGGRISSESMIREGMDDLDLNDFVFADFSVSLRYHLYGGRNPITIGVGPYFSIVADRDKYNTVWDTTSGKVNVDGLKKVKASDFGIVPSINFDVLSFMSIGIKANLGIKDVNEKYPERFDIDSRRFNSVQATLALRF